MFIIYKCYFSLSLIHLTNSANVLPMFLPISAECNIFGSWHTKKVSVLHMTFCEFQNKEWIEMQNKKYLIFI